jgi:tripartite-type tricarboxylate transporter receptor subunit TctC
MRRALAALALIACGAAAAQDWPSRPVALIVPYTPGTGADILARLVGPKLAERWKIGVVTENKAGATGNIGAEFVAKSPPDGNTLLFVATSFTTMPALAASLPFDPVKSFAPIALLATSGLVLVVNPEVPARSLREFIALARREPGKLNYSSPGNGGPQHLTMELLKLETGINVVHVPYKGAAGALADVVAGHVHATVATVQTVVPHLHSGKLRGLGVMSYERSAAIPDVPTLREQGLRELEVETWYGAFAPAGTPATLVAKINSGINAALKDAAVRDALAKQGMAPAGGPPEVLGARVDLDLMRWKRVVKEAGIRAD